MIESAKVENFEVIHHDVDLCVVGGGIAGMCTAISAARHGLKVVLMQDRPVLGGNASSEVRMWIRGAHGKNMRETGILEEMALENIYRNPRMNFSVWDSVLFGIVHAEKNIELLLNCSCLDACMNGNTIVSVKGWQSTTQCYHEVSAKVFTDASGDSVLAPLTGAKWRMGRESSEEFGESIAPHESDDKTMGMSCLIQARQRPYGVKYTPPTWANKYKKEDFTNKINFRWKGRWTGSNFWWMELGGLDDSIRDSERLRDDLVKMAFGVWDFIKNGKCLRARNWDIEWIGFVPGKRESRRYVGKYMMTQHDVESGGHFDDIIAYGGWSMDDHNPAGFASTEPPTTYHHAPSPYGISYRCLVSENIANLTFVGRNISATHSAMSSTRVMATCGIMGQALGTAIAIALRDEMMPADLDKTHIEELQQTLLRDDCYIPWMKKELSSLMQSAKIEGKGNVDILQDGVMRPVDGVDHVYKAMIGQPISIALDKGARVNNLRLILDSDLNRRTQSVRLNNNFKRYPMHGNIPLGMPKVTMPKTLLKDIIVKVDGEVIAHIKDNHKRLVIIPIDRDVKEIEIVPKKSWGSPLARIYDIDLD